MREIGRFSRELLMSEPKHSLNSCFFYKMTFKAICIIFQEQKYSLSTDF